MKKNLMKRILHKRLRGGITTYVFIMFGTALILYMFGFQSMFGTTAQPGYVQSATANGTSGNITDPDFQMDSNPINMAIDAILAFAKENPLYTFGGLSAFALLLLIGYVTGGSAITTFLTYLIPIGLLAVFLNYFVFPVNLFDENLRQMMIADGLPASVALLIFFNLFLVLSLFDFITGRQT